MRLRFSPPARALRLLPSLLLAAFLLPGAVPLRAEEVGADDAGSGEKKRRIIPIPIFVTEPAIGYGLGAAVAYFHDRKDEEEPAAGAVAPALTAGNAGESEEGQKRPPDVTGVAATYTDKGTWLVGGGHFASWRRDTVRYTGILAYANIESTFFFRDRPFDFNLRGGALYQDLRFRVHGSRFFLGGKLSYLDAEGAFKSGRDLPIDFGYPQFADFGVAAEVVYEGRDNAMTPGSGQLIELVLWKHFEAFGTDYDYGKVAFKLHSFHPFAESFVLGLRLEVEGVTGEPPLWSYPWIKLRGIPGLRYQNQKAGVAETELRWDILDRWAVLAFVGVGSTWGDAPLYKDESGIVAGGIGGRYLFRPEDDIWVGVDIGWGPEDTPVYVQVGHAW
jgi:hypothetical protein